MVRISALLVVFALVLGVSAHSNNNSRRPGNGPGNGRGTGNGRGHGTGNNNSTCPPNNPEKNKQVALAAYQEAFQNRNVDNLETYYQTEYIQHNPMITDGLQGFKDFIRIIPEGDGIPDIKRAAADGDLVFLHVAMSFFGVDYAIVDVYRFECGKIKEHWDVMQDRNVTNSANSHPFF